MLSIIDAVAAANEDGVALRVEGGVVEDTLHGGEGPRCEFTLWKEAARVLHGHLASTRDQDAAELRQEVRRVAFGAVNACFARIVPLGVSTRCGCVDWSVSLRIDSAGVWS